ncbi:MAG: hypothetical protein A2X78_02055 [Gammaproteobacteria bacterium GWE2_37_16]|nr:MAG: hypothetical protein A2X78_02055 [Gammaproteobacteria bacterium GWE2_37_16]
MRIAISKKISILEFLNEYLQYVETGNLTQNLNSLMEGARKSEGNRRWIHAFADTDLKKLQVLEGIVGDLLKVPVTIIQKEPNCYLKLSKLINVDIGTDIEEVIDEIKVALRKKYLLEKSVCENKIIAKPFSIIAIPTILPAIPISLPLFTTRQETPHREKRAKVMATIIPRRKIFSFKSILFFAGGIALILILAILLRRYLNNVPKKMTFFSPPANHQITPTLDGVEKVDIDCSKIATKFADCRSNVSQDQIKTCLGALKIDETAVFNNTPEIQQGLSVLAPDCEMQLHIHNKASYSAVAKVLRNGRDTLVAPSVGAMSCLLNILQSNLR